MNRELFKKIDDIITPDPDKLDMGSWEEWDDNPECSTTRCIAGWAITLTTGQPLYVRTEEGLYRQHPSVIELARRLGTTVWRYQAGFDEVNIPKLAAKLLDIPSSHRHLFYSEDEVGAAYVKAAAEGREDDAERVLGRHE
jgi:hypothetical protein